MNICPRCRSSRLSSAGKVASVPWKICRNCDFAGEAQEFRPETVFDRITRSVKVLAESSVYFEEEHILVSEDSDCGVTIAGGWTSPFIEYKYRTKPEAIAATINELEKTQ